MATDVYTSFVRVHAAGARHAHGTPAFLPWHRVFLLEFEDALRVVDPRVTLPYWDWSADAANPASSPVWGADILGGSTPGLCIPDGPFAGATVQLPRPHCVRRGFTTTGRGPPSMGGATFDEPPVLAALINGNTSYSDFAAAVEFSHGAPHVAVGSAQLRGANAGDMALVSSSANEPAFYLHHTFIDSLWARRQAVHGATDYGGPPGRAPARPSDSLSLFGAATVANTFSLPCVTYAAPVAAAAAAAAAAPAPRGRSARGSTLPRSRAEAVVEAARARREAVQVAFARAGGRGAEAVERARRVVAAAATDAFVAGALVV
ncbi:hypothetical protein I4F81_003398 [Pyropia yezoensis]|uniref:Uncharacterized protein n=1 Tax=Pyropia yezoensis TaxID=2788 RepID=A0ACC3BTP6_PYRYE|nr:hypothetical protein I4F81_003398 [Neopyropia yezoensis]